MSGTNKLQKKLKSIRATGKLSKALKTVSAAKFSKLSALWKNYSRYAEQYRFLYGEPTDGDRGPDRSCDCVIVMASNKGFCGGFNAEILNYVRTELAGLPLTCPLVVCGQQIAQMIADQFRQPDARFMWDDIPTLTGCEDLFCWLSERLGGRPDAVIRVIYPHYRNTMIQTPESEYLFPYAPIRQSDEDLLWVPDRETVMAGIREKGFRALLYGMVLETALGAQAATLLTMRSAYDTATEYGEALESEIHRRRQSAITADVIETSSERASKAHKSESDFGG